jgi:transcriptional regulator with XRE-family HTH domain
MNIEKVGLQISELRKNKGLTQNDLGERLGVSFQAVSKWERGETLPDTSILPDLASVLCTTIDYILNGGEKRVEFKGKINVSDMISGIKALKDMGEYLGKDNLG